DTLLAECQAQPCLRRCQTPQVSDTLLAGCQPQPDLAGFEQRQYSCAHNHFKETGMAATAPLPRHVPVLIAGGGPVGLTLAALLAEYGIESLTVEADDGYCTGSRAICISRRSLEILSWIGADRPLLDKGLAW